MFDAIVPTTPPPFHLESALASIDKMISLEPLALYYSHFGKALNGVQRLKNYKEQLKLWAKIACEGVAENLSFEQIRDRIVNEDKVMNQLADYLRGHRIYSKTALTNSIQGFISYAKQAQANFSS
jgi:hypothetical protein